MSTPLQVQFDELQLATEEFLSRIKGWADSKLVQKPDDESWSANQVVEHLLTSEGGTLGYMKKKTSSGWDSLEVAGGENQEAGNALVSRLSGSSRMKAPSVLPEPTNQISFSEMTDKWKLLRTDLRSFLSEVQPEHFNKLVFRQPSVGMLDILSTLRFMTAHVRHHTSQLDRIKTSLGI